MKKVMGLYIHIPFCVRKCSYCDFISAPSDIETQKRYLKALCRELELLAGTIKGQTDVCSVFIGGGTPSVLPGEYIKELMSCVFKSFTVLCDAEITIECNPGTLDREKLSLYKESGINRISIGLQSTDDGTLKKLGRIHTFAEFKENYRLARKLGFDNINIDLMSALPDQTLLGYEKTLKEVTALKPEHISAYSLIIEEGTPFFDADLNLPDEDTEREMYHTTKAILEDAGYKRYEISNYAKPGYESRHNMLYWTGADYLGAGLAASSFVNNRRWSNISKLSSYLELLEVSAPDISRLTDGEHIQTEKELMEEYCFLGLRLVRGISISKFKERFSRDFFYVYGETVKKYTDMGMLELANDRLRLTDAGIDVSNVILADFLLD